MLPLFIREFGKKKEKAKKLARLPQIAREHNARVVAFFSLLKSNQLHECLEEGRRWLGSIPVLSYIASHHIEMQGMPEPMLLKHCSTHFKPQEQNYGMSRGERSRIYRRLKYGPSRYFNGCDVANLIFAVCCSRLGRTEDGLRWKSDASSGAHLYWSDYSNFIPAELWRIIELSTIRDLNKLGFVDEVEYLKGWLPEDQLGSVYAPRDYAGPDPLGDVKQVLRTMDRFRAKIDYDYEYFVVTSPEVTFKRSFGESGLVEIIEDMVGCIRKEPALVDRSFETKFLEPDSPF